MTDLPEVQLVTRSLDDLEVVEAVALRGRRLELPLGARVSVEHQAGESAPTVHVELLAGRVRYVDHGATAPASWSAVLEWDVVESGVLGALVTCHACALLGSSTGCETCSGSGRLHREYRAPGGAHVDLHRTEDLLRAAARVVPDEDLQRTLTQHATGLSQRARPRVVRPETRG